MGIDLTLDPRADSFTVENGIASAILTEPRSKVEEAKAKNRGSNKKQCRLTTDPWVGRSYFLITSSALLRSLPGDVSSFPL